jgi:hypothetical protein
MEAMNVFTFSKKFTFHRKLLKYIHFFLFDGNNKVFLDTGYGAVHFTIIASENILQYHDDISQIIILRNPVNLNCLVRQKVKNIVWDSKCISNDEEIECSTLPGIHNVYTKQRRIKVSSNIIEN